MKQALLTLALISGSALAQQGTSLAVSLDPLPYGTVQLGWGQYMIPNVNGMNVLLYSASPLTLAQPGQAYTPKTTLSLSPLPLGAVRMNDTQYMLPNVMPGVMALIISDKPLTFTQTQFAITNPAAGPVLATQPAPPAPVTAAPVLAAPGVNALAMPGTGMAQVPAPAAQPLATASAPVAAPPPSPVDLNSSAANRTATAVPAPTTPAKPTAPVTSAPTARGNTAAAGLSASLRPTPVMGTAAPTSPPAPAVASTVVEPAVPARTSAQPAAPALTTEVRSAQRLPRLPGLPDDLTGSLNAKEENGQVTITYALTNLGQRTYTLKPTDLRLSQEDRGLRARLDRRNGNLTPGTLTPQKGEIGTITVHRVTNAPITLMWTVRAGEANYILKYTVNPAVALKNE